MGKKDKNKVLIGSIIIILSVVAIFSLVAFNSDGEDEGQTFSISFIDQPTVNTVPLDFCNSEQECLNYLSQQGMPDNFLQLNGYKILCQNENCFTQKI